MPRFIRGGDEMLSPQEFAEAALPPAPDLGTQLEDLITQVYHCEAWARVEERIDLALKILRDR